MNLVRDVRCIQRTVWIRFFADDSKSDYALNLDCEASATNNIHNRFRSPRMSYLYQVCVQFNIVSRIGANFDKLCGQSQCGAVSGLAGTGKWIERFGLTVSVAMCFRFLFVCFFCLFVVTWVVELQIKKYMICLCVILCRAFTGWSCCRTVLVACWWRMRESDWRQSGNCSRAKRFSSSIISWSSSTYVSAPSSLRQSGITFTLCYLTLCAVVAGEQARREGEGKVFPGHRDVWGSAVSQK